MRCLTWSTHVASPLSSATAASSAATLERVWSIWPRRCSWASGAPARSRLMPSTAVRTASTSLRRRSRSARPCSASRWQPFAFLAHLVGAAAAGLLEPLA